jgi:hypothetical protein
MWLVVDSKTIVEQFNNNNKTCNEGEAAREKERAREPANGMKVWLGEVFAPGHRQLLCCALKSTRKGEK